MTAPAAPHPSSSSDDSGPHTMMIPRIEATGAIPVIGGELRRPRRRSGRALRVDWPSCKAHGLCHELFPERISLDEWGYPIVDAAPVRGRNLDEAKRAVAACPTLALRLVDPPSR